MTTKPEAPEHIYAKYSDAEPYNGKRGLIIDNEPFEGAQEFIRHPRLKPLVWEGDGHWSNGDNEGWMEEANTPFGWGYSIEFGINGAFKADSTFGWSQDGFENPEAAKAAAQADYERRIMEALE